MSTSARSDGRSASTPSPGSRARAALHVTVRGGTVADVKLRIYEPPRFFEAFLRGRDFREAPDITARICGICPVAYQMSAVHAMEEAFGVDGRGAAPRAAPPALLRRVDREPRAPRLHAPRPRLPRLRERHPHGAGPPGGGGAALALKKIGNDLVTLLGGREIHPINVSVGGFYRVPAQRGAAAARRAARSGPATLPLETVALGRRLRRSPTSSRTTSSSSLRHPDEYPFNEGRLVSSQGLDIAVSGVRGALRRGARPALERPPLGPRRAAAPTSSGRWPATA